ncbi:hypothetical protein JCM15765_15720 [Paradesulfitobacterium aromaticivorans]
MKLVYQRFWNHSVTRVNTRELLVVTTYLDTQSEYRVGLRVGVGDLVILGGEIECYRQQGEHLIKPRIIKPNLQGIQAYFGSGRQVKEALKGDQVLVELVLENIMAVIQAEAYLYKDRGFPTPEAYDDYWNQNFQGSCKYYSNLDLVNTRFMEHIEPKERTDSLFTRFRNTAVYQTQPERWQITVNFNDSFHEMILNLSCRGEDFQVTEIEGTILRCPDRICKQAVSNLQDMEGASLAGAKEKDILKATGGGEGCTHLGFMAVDAAKAVSLVRPGIGG